jgi:uncharacterized protein YdhG (YjbR/CyaY superfamily)
MASSATTVDEYIAGFPDDTQDVLQELRRRIHAAVPNVEERISYQIPTFAVDGQYVIYVAGWKNHVSIYPVPEGDADLAPYLFGQGTLKLPLGRPVPWDVVDRAITQQVATRVAQIRG